MTTPNTAIHRGLSTACVRDTPVLPPGRKAGILGTHGRKRNDHPFSSLAGYMMWNLCVRTEITADAFISASEHVP